MNTKVLKILADNARCSIEDIATMTGLSLKEVTDEIGELESAGLIRGYKAVIDWEKLDNASVSALIELKVIPQDRFGFENIAETIMKYKEVETVYLMSGSYDLCVIVKGKTFQEVARFVAKELATMREVTSTATHFVLRRYKELDVELVDGEQDDRGAYSL
ncbi:MAG: Lrp/AsnC family transcriptional regulator [Ruminococcaceae bacterium]|nr:Lrp/AsnC family transcriptional regulator [Oscillospiraceae bacterium]